MTCENCDYLRAELARVTRERDEAVYHAELQGARKALDAVVKMLESCNYRIVPIGWDETAWERFCLHRYGAADDVRAMKPEDVVDDGVVAMAANALRRADP